MFRIRFLALTALLSACSTSGSYTGQLVAQLGSNLPEGLRIVAQADDSTSDLTCQTFEATPDASGAFVLTGLCADTSYTLSLTEKNLLIEGSHTIQGTTEEVLSTLLKVWPASAGNGVAMFTEGKLKAVSTYTNVKKLQLLESEEDVLYPRHKPNSSVLMAEGAHLVLTGQNTVSKLVFQPLIEEKVERNFHDEYTLGPHFYVGLRFTTDTEVERVEAALDAGKVINVLGADMPVRYIAHDALPPGHYALMGEGDERMYTITFGPQPEQTVSENTP